MSDLKQGPLSLTCGSPVPRPKLTIEQKAEAIQSVAAIVDIPANRIALAYRQYMDGYRLARELDESGNMEMSDIEALDTVGSLIDDARRNLEKKWAEDTNPQPPFPIGTRLTVPSMRGGSESGVIAGLYEYEPAKYKVKIDGETDPSSFRLINFEHAAPEVPGS